ncbi:hypothetical protein ACSMXN_20820 [Jatrophihabitans sp. DSM 45814]
MTHEETPSFVGMLAKLKLWLLKDTRRGPQHVLATPQNEQAAPTGGRLFLFISDQIATI